MREILKGKLKKRRWDIQKGQKGELGRENERNARWPTDQDNNVHPKRPTDRQNK
jgi:hypothetical protein